MSTFAYVTERIFVWFVGTHAPLHVWGVNAGLEGRVGRHVLSWETRVISFRKRVLQVDATPEEAQVTVSWKYKGEVNKVQCS